MPKLTDAVDNAFSEARMLLLGGQVLLGFSYRICFEDKFEQIARSAQLAEVVGLGVMTSVLGWLIWPAAFHQLKEHGRMTASIHSFTTTVLDWALLPLALGLGLTLYTVATALDLPYAPMIGAAAGIFAIAVWYGWSRAGRNPGAKQKVAKELAEQEKKNREKPDLSDRIKKVLLECRMALPGAQAFLGFQFAIVFTQGFEKLPRPWQLIHFASLLATTISTVLLITPAAYHRIHEAGEDTEHFHKIAGRLLLAALVFLGPGMAGDLFLVIAKVTQSPGMAGAIAGFLLLAFYSLWFGVSAWRKK
ncbi:MAG TPA: DUF6328 family protein [Candidatus Angelobacter sp.]|jgi:hypothetical protein|nr:DUF6328 family protein [Candidatus Angelobacter sp.]